MSFLPSPNVAQSTSRRLSATLGLRRGIGGLARLVAWFSRPIDRAAFGLVGRHPCREPNAGHDRVVATFV